MRSNQLQAADDELVALFTATCGGRGQSYEKHGHGLNPSAFDEPIVLQIDRARMANQSTPIETFDAVRGTLASINFESRITLQLVYEPFGTWFSTGTHSETKRGRKQKFNDGETPDCLARALRPSWGGGSFVRLAITMPETTQAFRRQFDGKEVTPSGLRSFLVREAIEPGSDRKKLFRELRAACEGPRSVALKVYDVAREARVAASEAERVRIQRLRQAEREALLEEELQMTRRIARARFERMLAQRKSCPTQ